MIPAGASNRIVAGEFDGTFEELSAVDLPDRAAVFVHGQLDALRVVWHHATHERETLIASHTRSEPALIEALLAAGLNVVDGGSQGWELTPTEIERDPVVGRIWLLTSGSTGRPKQVAHTLDSLTTVRGAQPERTWLCPYTPGAYAWWQLVTLALTQPGQSLVCVDPSQDWVEQAAIHHVTAASGTPTFWRQALLSHGVRLAEIPLEQITLGGEPVDQSVIDQLRESFPQARISWIYASSEAGATIAVHDGKAGFPDQWLDQDSPDRPRISIDGQELVIASPYRGEGVDAVLRTGDRVEHRDGRIYIVGRLASDEINVGGTKVSASQVRGVLLEHPAVVWAAVKGRKAPMVGAIVQADVVVSDAAIGEAELSRWCSQRLAAVAVPRRFTFRDEIPMKESLKSDV